MGVRDLWVLGDYRCGGGLCLALVRSTDGGKHFARVGLPSFPSQGTDPTLEFANPRDGFAYLPYEGPLYSTHDGGESWHRAGPVGHVLAFAVGGRVAYVVTTRHRLERSPVSRDAWRVLRRAGTRSSLAARGSHVWLLGDPRRKPDSDTLARSSDGGRTFRTGPGPCLFELGGRLAPAGAGVVWAVCPTGMMAGVSRSADGGRSFAHTHAPVVTNGGQVFPVSPREAFLAGGGDGPLLRTRDGGNRWTTVHLPFRIVQLDWLGFTSSRVGLVLDQTRSSPASTRLWRTTDGGATWHSLRLR